MKLASQDSVLALDADFGEMAVSIGRHAWGLQALTMREKAFVFVAADLCNHALGFPLQTHVTMAVSNGVAVDDIREVVRHLAPYAGYPTAAEALMRLAEMEQGLAGGQVTDSAGNDPVQLPAEVLDGIRQLDNEFADFVAQQFAERWGRGNLTVRERALATIAVDVMHGTLDDSLRLHLGLALADGTGEEQVRAVLLLLSEFGLAKTWRAYSALNRILSAGTADLAT
jgi:4-carboxymuconolactone decarboxylase